jgi:dCTP deaminase
MILTKSTIKKGVDSGDIVISPFRIEQLGTISYRFRIATKIRTIRKAIDSKKPTDFLEEEISEDGLILEPSILYLASTLETLGSKKYAQQIFGVRDIGCMGIFLNVSANLGHVGAVTQWTLEMTVDRPVVVYPKQIIGQIVFWRLYGDATLYDGEYQNMTEPLMSKLWKEV